MIERVLIPTDGSDCAEAAAELAINLADNYGATLHALYVSETVPDKLDRPPILDSDPEETDCEALREIHQHARECGFDDVTGAISSGYPFREIIRYIETRRIDLVVMGTHGRTGVERVLNRSTTEYVLRRSPAPVLAIPHSSEEQKTIPLIEN